MQAKNNKLIQLIPTKHSSVFQVRLNLEYQTRYIGQLDTAGQGTFFARRKPKHLFRRTNSLGINLELLKEESIPFQRLVIDFDNHKLVTSRLYFLTHGKVFTFGKAGFETQCFLPLDAFGFNKAREWESEQTEQLALFEEAAV